MTDPTSNASGAAAPADAAGEVSSYLKRLLNYAVDNPAKTLSLTVLSYGGLLLLVYFARIGFMPEVSLESLTSVLYAVALLGLMVACYVTATLVIPGIYLGEARDGNPAITDASVALVAFAVAVGWGIAFAAILYGWNVWVCACAVLAIAGYVFCVWRVSSADSPPKSAAPTQLDQPAKVDIWREPRVWIVVNTLICGFLTLIPLTLVAVLGLRGDLVYADSTKVMFSLVMSIAVIAAVAMVLGSTEKAKRWRMAIVLGPLLLFWVSLMTGSFSAISAVAVNKLGLGEYPFVRAVVSGKTCKQVNHALGQMVCDPGAGDDMPTSICPALLRSRIGSQVVLEFASLVVERGERKEVRMKWATSAGQPEQEGEGPKFRRVVLAKEQLLSWSNLPHRPVSAMPAASSPTEQHFLNEVCGMAALPSPSASSPASSASAPAVIQIDAKGSAAHQTVVNVQLQNAVSQTASTQSAASAKAAAGAKAVNRVAPRPIPGCSMSPNAGACCPPNCCSQPAVIEPGEAARSCVSRDAG